MHVRLSVYCAVLVTVGVPVASATEATKACGAEVEAAFEKQRKSKGWQEKVVSKTVAGVQTQTFTYVPPASMHRKIEAPGNQVLETIGIGKHAWFDEGNGWYEMQPQFGRMVTQHLRTVFVPEKKEAPEFICLGDVSYEGNTYKGYRTPPAKAGDTEGLVRTIYVDPKTGLLAFNLISKVGEESSPNVHQVYTYADNLKVEPPVGAPMATKN
ncbi:MAG: hypothetical protein K0U34_03185 [Alphaproteobacteria bacterium]|nr:hypothetical protein [Alphaproteobacteria bacterium]